MKRPPALAAPLFVVFAVVALCAALAAACGGGEAEPAVSAPEPTAAALPGGEVIPVEALPDPLPEPYLFRDTVTVEREQPSEVIHVVVPGDTLAGIAGGYCVTLEEIQRLNNIVDPTALSIGQELRIPIREGACGVAAPQTAAGDATESQTQEPAAPQRPPGEIYVVEPGDTLADIAAAFGFGWRDIASYNNLSDFEAESLQVGQELVIPPASAVAPEEEEEADRAEPPG